MTSEPPKRCGFSNEVSAISSPRFQIDKAQHNRRGAKVHCDAKNRPGGAINFNAVDKDSISVARHRGVELRTRDC